jgi:hypothetical protein
MLRKIAPETGILLAEVLLIALLHFLKHSYT